MRFSVSTASFLPRPLGTALAWAKAAGCDGVELALTNGGWGCDPEAVQRQCDRYGLPVLTVHTPLLHTPWHDTKARLEAALAVAAGLGGVPVVAHLPIVEPEPTLALLRQAQSSGVPLAIENHSAYKSGTREPTVYRAYLEGLRHLADTEGFRLTFDVSHAGAVLGDPWEAYEIVAPHVVNIHLSDYSPRRPPRLLSFLSRYTTTMVMEHQLLGAGQLPLRPFLARLAASGYRGIVTLEANPLSLGVWSGRRFQRNLRRCLAFCHEGIAAASR